MYHMVQITVSVDIRATADRVWAALMDVEAYPSWNRGVTRTQRVSGTQGLAPGDRVRITQPRFGTGTWTVTRLDPGTRFDWAQTRGLVTSTATHAITPTGVGVRLDLGLRHEGLGAGLTDRLFGRQARWFVQTEAEGCRALCESR